MRGRPSRPLHRDLQWSIVLPRLMCLHILYVLTATSRKVAGSIPDEVIGLFSVDLILPVALWPWYRLSL
jgi:hypothetical protein